MLDIKKNHPLNVKTKVFTKHEEGQNGADWEWWFRYKKQWIGFRVQAKIINNIKNEFEHLHYKSIKTNVFQYDKLLQKALTYKHPKIPLYCCYLQTDDKRLLTTWSCKSYTTTRDLWGCSLISAFQVKKLQSKSNRHLLDLEPYLKPWHCLVCCAGYSGNNPVEYINNYAINNFPIDQEISNKLALIIPDSFITDEPPQYVLHIVENENNNNISTDDKKLRGVLIYTFDDYDLFRF